MRGKIIVIGAAALIIVGIVALFILGAKTEREELSGNLTFWGVFDSPKVMSDIISAYKTLHPKVNISYTTADSVRYERDLVDALAGPNPPDIVMFHNSWLPKHFNKVAPFAPEQFSVSNLRNLFPTIAEQDFAPDGLVYALPLHIDTLAMFYNQDIFDNKGVALPPKTWKEFESVVVKIRETDKQGRVVKAAAALGGSNRSINRATDILNLMMLQAGAEMVDDNFQNAAFDSPSGLSAFTYYLKFANPLDSLYTWNDAMAYSLDSFAAGETAIMFNYAYQNAFLKEKSPFLKFRVAPMPQPENRVQDINYANYWGLAVSANSRNKAVAQDFIIFATADSQNAATYLNGTGRPPALRPLINQMLNHPELGVFARQALTARSWPQIDNAAVETIFSNMVASVLAGQLSAERALQEAASSVTDLMQRRAL